MKTYVIYLRNTSKEGPPLLVEEVQAEAFRLTEWGILFYKDTTQDPVAVVSVGSWIYFKEKKNEQV